MQQVRPIQRELATTPVARDYLCPKVAPRLGPLVITRVKLIEFVFQACLHLLLHRRDVTCESQRVVGIVCRDLITRRVVCEFGLLRPIAERPVDQHS